MLDPAFRNPPILSPGHELAQGIDLVIVFAFWEGEDLIAKVIEPRGALWQ
jgi:hypothetical protein